MDWRVFLFLLTMALLASIIAGLPPLLYASRLNVSQVLSSNWPAISRRLIPHHALIVFEVALACLFSVVAGLLIKSFYEVSKIDLGFSPHQVISFQINLPGSRYQQPEQMTSFHKRFLDKLAAVPGITNISGLSSLPLTRQGDLIGLETDPPAPSTTSTTRPLVEYECVFPQLFRTLQMPIVQGRDFTDADRANAPRVVIIDDQLAAKYWPGQSPLSKRLRLPEPADPNPPWREVVGVVRQIKHFGPEVQPRWMQVYLPQAQEPTLTVSFVLNSTLPPLASLKPAVQKALYELDKDLPLDNFQTMDDLLDSYTASRKLSFLLLASFAALAIILATIGIYGVVSNSVIRRRREIAIRVSLGARRSNILLLIAGSTALCTLAGLAIGTLATLALAGILRTFLFGTTPLAPTAYATSLAGIALLALLACLIPTATIFRVNPQEILRE